MDSLATATALESLAMTYRANSQHPLRYGHAMDWNVTHQIERIAESRGTTDQQVSKLGSSVARLCEYACPMVNPDNPELLSIFADPAHIATGRRTTGKPGKLLGKLLPMATGKEKEAFAVWWKETIILPRDGLTIKETQDGKEIAAVYMGKQARSSDPSLSARGWKSLAASCMRYDFCDLPQHPTTVYASGDFRLYWVENSAGEIAARVIVAIRNGRFVPGPIYCNSNIAGDLLEKHIAQEREKPREGKSVDSDSWINCRLVRVEYNGGLIAPYLDQQQDASDTGEAIRLCSRHNGDFTLDSTQGVIFPDGAYTCHDCDERLSEDDSFHDDNGTCYCESCYSERFTMCDHCYETTARDDMVNILDWRGRVVDCACSYCVSSGDIDVVEIERDFYEMDSVVFDSDGTAHVSDSGTYFVSDLTGDIHSTDDLHTLPNGDSCTMDEAVETGNWVLSREKIGTTLVLLDDGTRYERDKTRVVLVLRPWLELDSNGDVINRQPKLLDVGLPGVEYEMEDAA
jgi:hypothetical protein